MSRKKRKVATMKAGQADGIAASVTVQPIQSGATTGTFIYTTEHAMADALRERDSAITIARGLADSVRRLASVDQYSADECWCDPEHLTPERLHLPYCETAKKALREFRNLPPHSKDRPPR